MPPTSRAAGVEPVRDPAVGPTRRPPIVVVIPATTSTVVTPSACSTGPPARARSLDHLAHRQVAHTLLEQLVATWYQARARGCLAVHCATSISDQVRAS